MSVKPASSARCGTRVRLLRPNLATQSARPGLQGRKPTIWSRKARPSGGYRLRPHCRSFGVTCARALVARSEVASLSLLGGHVTKLGPVSSWIVHIVGCGSLIVLLAAMTCPAFGAPVARTVASLTATELATLPDATLIKVNAGPTVSLGILRSQHQSRLHRFAMAAFHVIDFVEGNPDRPIIVGSVYNATAPRTRTAVPSALNKSLPVPMDFSVTRFGVPGPLPADFVAFCKAATATACLYLPSGVPLAFGSGAAVDTDPLVIDAGLCSTQGGAESASGCAYSYPLKYNVNFNPGQRTSQGYNLMQSTNCPSPFSDTVDPKNGAVSLSYKMSGAPHQPFVGPPTFSALQSCVVRVYLNQ